MTYLFVVNCNGRERFRLKRSETGTVQTSRKRISLERLGPDGWHTLETTTPKGSWSDGVEELIDRLRPMYGAPAPTEIIPYDTIEPVNPERFRNRYGIDEDVELNLELVQTEEERKEELGLT